MRGRKRKPKYEGRHKIWQRCGKGIAGAAAGSLRSLKGPYCRTGVAALASASATREPLCYTRAACTRRYLQIPAARLSEPLPTAARPTALTRQPWHDTIGFSCCLSISFLSSQTNFLHALLHHPSSLSLHLVRLLCASPTCRLAPSRHYSCQAGPTSSIGLTDRPSDPTDRASTASLFFETRPVRRGMGRDPKQYVVALAGLYAFFQLLTQAANPAAFPKSNSLSPGAASPWRPQR